MSILVLSDTHGLTDKVNQMVLRATKRKRFDHIVHCGDFRCDRHQPPFDKMVQVRGNCDTDHSVPEEQIIDWQGVRILVVHGHLLNVKSTSLNLKYRALEVKANIVLFGHTHVLTCGQSQGVLYINPGSLARPRHFPHPTFAVLDRVHDQQIDSVRVKVSFYTPALRKILKKGGIFTIPNS